MTVACALPAYSQAILSDDFDAPAVSGWIGQGNTQTFSAQNITQADSVITSEVVATQSNTNRGIVSEASFEPAAVDGFRMTFVATTPTVTSSFRDGFTATVSADRNGWTYEITGLLDAAGSSKAFSGNGTWATAGTTFEALWPAGQKWHVMAAN